MNEYPRKDEREGGNEYSRLNKQAHSTENVRWSEITFLVAAIDPVKKERNVLANKLFAKESERMCAIFEQHFLIDKWEGK